MVKPLGSSLFAWMHDDIYITVGICILFISSKLSERIGLRAVSELRP